MIYNYVKLEINRYIADYYFKKSVLPSLKNQLESMDGMSGLPTKEKVQEMPKHDGMEQLIIAREHIRESIESHEQHIREYEQARGILDETESQVIHAFFTHTTKQEALDELDTKLGLGDRTSYRIRESALNKLSMALLG